MFFHYTQNPQNIARRKHAYTPCDADTERVKAGFSTPLHMGLRGGCFPTLWISLDGFPNFLKNHHGKTEHDNSEHRVFNGRQRILR